MNNKNLLLMGGLLLVLIIGVACGNQETSGDTGQSTPVSSETTAVNDPQSAGQNQFASEKYGFSLNYDQLTFDDKIDGDRFLELKHASGGTLTVTIKKPDPLLGENPEEWLMNSFKDSEYKIVQRKEVKLGQYKGLLVEYEWMVMGKPIRTIDLTAYKDGYFYTVIVTMREENVDAERAEFDKAVKSFRLLDNPVDIEALKPWRENIPGDYPFEVMDLYGISELTSVFGKAVNEGHGITILYDVSEDIQYEAVIDYFKGVLKDSPDFELSPHEDKTEIDGTKGGYKFEIDVRYYKVMERTKVSLAVEK